MSQSSSPFEMAPDAVMKPVEDMQNFMSEMARNAALPHMMSPLMAHPAAAAVAATALGFGAASHMTGLMLGSWQGAVEASRRMGVDAFDMTAGFRALDGDWNAALGRAAADTVETATRRASEATRDVAAEAAAAPAETPQAAMRRAEAMTAETVAAVADVVEKAARTVVKAAEPVEKATLAAKSATPAAKPAAPAKAFDAGKPAAMARPERPDDLKQIAGIGPKLEEVLNRLGIWSFGQIAGWGEGEVAWVDDYLQARGRIGRDGWIDQAKALTKK